MTLEEKKQIYLDRFPAIIGKRMSDQFDESYFDSNYFLSDGFEPCYLITDFQDWELTNENFKFWSDIFDLYDVKEIIEHQQILEIFNKHNIKP